MTPYEAWMQRMDTAHVPHHLRDGIARYIVDRTPTGGFLTAVFSNDLKQAFARADEHSRRGLLELVTFMYEHMPMSSQGSPEIVEEWLKKPDSGVLGQCAYCSAINYHEDGCDRPNRPRNIDIGRHIDDDDDLYD